MAMLMVVVTTEATDQRTISKNRQRLGVLVSEATRRKNFGVEKPRVRIIGEGGYAHGR
jgi:hypothetical protein